MKIPKEIVSKIIETADIADVIGEYVKLSRRGRNFIGLCPFHNEKTPSFIVSPDKSIYKCFGCHKAGNVVSFLMEYNSVPFHDAIKDLAERYSVQLPKYSQESDKSYDNREMMYNALSEAAAYYHKLLYSKTGAETLKYFKSRDFNDATIKKFQLGFAPDAFTELIDYLKKKNYSEDILLSAGLAYKNEKNRVFDRFRNRAVFPIKDFIGRVVGFGARLMSDDKSQAKYINSPQSEIYDKSSILYGLFEAKNSIRQKGYTILTEGYADVITLSQNETENVVASSGTALTYGQLKLLKKFSDKIFFCYDGDSAGQKATDAGAELALANGFEVLIIRLPEDEDPDSLVRKNGASLDYYIQNAQDYIEYKLDKAKSEGITNSIHGLSGTLKSIIEIISKIPDEIQHDFYLRKVANKLSLTESQLRNAYQMKAEFREKYLNNISDDSESFLANPEAEKNEPDITEDSEEIININDILTEEKIIIKSVLDNPNNFVFLFENTDFSMDLLISKESRFIFNILMEFSEENDFIHSIIQSDLSENLKEIFASLAVENESPSEKWHTKLKLEKSEVDEIKILKDSIKKLKIRALTRKVEEVRQLVKQEPNNDNHIKRQSQLNREIMLLVEGD